MNKTLHVGLDVGSTTVKIIVMDENQNTIYKDYQRHFSDTKNTVCNVLESLSEMFPENELTIALTGSGAMSASKFLGVAFIQGDHRYMISKYDSEESYWGYNLNIDIPGITNYDTTEEGESILVQMNSSDTKTFNTNII